MPGRAIGLKWFGIDKAERTLKVSLTPPALVRPGTALKLPVKIELPIRNVDRSAGAMLSGEVAKRWKHRGLKDDTISVIDVESQKVVKSVPVGSFPWGVAVKD